MLRPPPTTGEDQALEDLARDMIEASRTIELLASRAAEQLESTLFEYAKQIRERAEAHLPSPNSTSAED